MKVFAALAVVLLHVGLTPGFSLGVPCFTYMLVRLGGRRPGESAPALIRRHADQLLLPWLLWSLLYLGLRELSPGGPTPGGPRLSGPLIGGYLHLWFLPFAFSLRVVFQLLEVEAWTLARRSSLSIIATLVACGLFLAAGPAQAFENPIPQWTAALPAAVMAFAVRMDPGRRRALMNCAIVCTFGLALDLHAGDIALVCLLVLVDLLSRQARTRAPAWISWGADLSWPVYLIHPAAIAGAEEVLGLTGRLEVFTFVILSSILAAWLLLRIAPLSRLLLRK
ncbi:MAG: acyltransferase family protein [Planctomycetes bacterium]|nr:acyltransferase family protein [Planctomycetota bacterium]